MHFSWPPVLLSSLKLNVWVAFFHIYIQYILSSFTKGQKAASNIVKVVHNIAYGFREPGLFYDTLCCFLKLDSVRNSLKCTDNLLSKNLSNLIYVHFQSSVFRCITAGVTFIRWMILEKSWSVYNLKLLQKMKTIFYLCFNFWCPFGSWRHKSP